MESGKYIKLGDAAFAMVLIVMAVMFCSWLAYKDCGHADDSELRLSGVYHVN